MTIATRNRPYDDIAIGEKAAFSKTITEADVMTFAALSGDVNPVHVDPDFARNTAFGRQIAHGMLAASLISTVIGTQLPGINSIYLGQELKFTAPVFFGDTLTAEVEVVEKRDDKPVMKLRTTVTKQDGTVVVEGVAVIKKPR
jgi:3-hydroxybutyryl-CoA dehydratase